MNDQILSQDEIDALLKREDKETGTPILTSPQFNALQEVGHVCLESVANILSAMIGKKVNITAPQIDIIDFDTLKAKYIAPLVSFEISFKQGLYGKSILFLHVPDALTVSNLMLGQEIPVNRDSLSDLELSTLKETVKHLVDSAADTLAGFLNRPVKVDRMTAKLLQVDDEGFTLLPVKERFVKAVYGFLIEGVMDSELILLCSLPFARETADLFEAQNRSWRGTRSKKEKKNAKPVRHGEKTPAVQQAVAIQTAQFAPIESPASVKGAGNLKLILDVDLELSVQLGKTKMMIKDVLELGSGSIIELDKPAGEPVDVLVNGKLIAKGEVVVVDEKFGVKIIDIVSPIERVHSLQ